MEALLGAAGSAEATGAQSARAVKVIRAGGVCGIAAVGVGIGSVLLAVAISPWFSWMGNALSDLGYPPAKASANVFNGGLILAGALFLEFVMGLSRAVPRGPFVRPSLVLLAIGALFLMGVGIFTEGVPVIHFVATVGYFFTYPPGIILFGVAARRVYKWVAPFSFLMAGGAFLFAVLLFTPVFPSAAIPELLASLILGSWTAVTGVWLIQGRLSAATVS